MTRPCASRRRGWAKSGVSKFEMRSETPRARRRSHHTDRVQRQHRRYSRSTSPILYIFKPARSLPPSSLKERARRAKLRNEGCMLCSYCSSSTAALVSGSLPRSESEHRQGTVALSSLRAHLGNSVESVIEHQVGRIGDIDLAISSCRLPVVRSICRCLLLASRARPKAATERKHRTDHQTVSRGLPHF
ncbi:hypothetical protein F4780DRAFT_3010 [Xylariomycetidae sp. FL0641]|nr:hypothetical protein F4780DRAFT_3010 [Xylariomycetidae sp. FL0641]